MPDNRDITERLEDPSYDGAYARAARLWEMSEKIESLSDDVERLRAENARLRKALATYACRCGDGDCYVDEFVPSCGRSARAALAEKEEK